MISDILTMPFNIKSNHDYIIILQKNMWVPILYFNTELNFQYFPYTSLTGTLK